MVGQQKYLSEEDVFKLMKEFLALCKRHLRDQNQILKLEDIYKKTIVDYLKGIFYSKDTSDLQKLLDGLRKEKRNVIEGRQDSTTAQTFSLLNQVQSHTLGLSSLKTLGKLREEDKHVDKQFRELTIQHIHEFIDYITKEIQKDTIILKGKYISLKDANDALNVMTEQVSEVHIVAEYCLRVDTNMILPGLNLVVVSPDIKIMCPVNWNVSNVFKIFNCN